MENTRENAAAFLKKCNEATFVAIPITPEGIMVAYAERVVASACSATSSIGEDEIQKAAIECLEASADLTETEEVFVLAGFYEGAKWAISRLSERKIVLPSEIEKKQLHTISNWYDGERCGWNRCIEEIKKLNNIKSI